MTAEDAAHGGSWIGQEYITDAERCTIIVAASLSVCSLLMLLYLYLKRAAFMLRHPGHLTAMKSICELVFCLMMIVVPLQSSKYLPGR